MNHKPLKIFLADDDEDDRDLFNEALNSLYYNCELITVSNGERAMNFFKEGNYAPDLIFLDINMPKKNGIECLKFIKSLYPKHKFPIIMLSTSSSPAVVEQSYAYGASIYIQKPSRFNELVRYLDYCITQLKTITSKEDFLLNHYLAKQEG